MSKSIRPSQRILQHLQEHHTTLQHTLKKKTEEFHRMKDAEAWNEIHEISLFMKEATQESRELDEYLQQFRETEGQERLTPENSYLHADELRPYILEALKGQVELTYLDTSKQVSLLMREYLMGADLETVPGKQPQARWYGQFKKAVSEMREAGLLAGEGHQMLSLTPAGQLAAEMLQGIHTYPVRRKLSAQSVKQHIPVSGYIDTILKVLSEARGPMITRKIIALVGDQCKERFTEADLELLTSKRPRWQDRVDAALSLMLKSGQVVYLGQKEGWKITDCPDILI